MRAALCLVLVIAGGCEKGNTTSRSHADTPSPKGGSGEKEKAGAVGFPPAEWTHKELANHLERKGVKVDVRSAPFFSGPGRTAAWFDESSTDSDKGQVLVQLCRENRDAVEQVGAMGDGAFVYGRFAIGVEGDRPARSRALLARIATALK